MASILLGVMGIRSMCTHFINQPYYRKDFFARKMCVSIDKHSQRIIWVDLELTGLIPEKDKVLEIACLVTDSDLNIVAEGPNIIIHQPPNILENMNEWCIENHAKSGLTEACKNSKISLGEAETAVINFVREHTPPGKCPLAGSSVYMDKIFLMKYFPLFVDHLHYRLIDVSTVGELCRRWYPQEAKPLLNKVSNHRAFDDIKESIEKLKYFRNTIFRTL